METAVHRALKNISLHNGRQYCGESKSGSAPSEHHDSPQVAVRTANVQPEEKILDHCDVPRPNQAIHGSPKDLTLVKSLIVLNVSLCLQKGRKPGPLSQHSLHYITNEVTTSH